MSSGLKQRVLTALIIGLPILFLVFYSNSTRLAFIFLVAILASHEFLRLFTGKILKNPLMLVSFLSGAALLLLANQFGEKLFLPFLLLSLAGNLFLLYDLFYREESIQKSYPAVWNLLYIILPLGALVSFGPESPFACVLISTLLLIWISDISAYFVGRTVGKRKLFERISPGKTWEGFWGAGLLTVLFSYAFFSYFGIYTVRQWAVIALCVWLFGSLGDLVESKLKRALDIKDSGQIMPGHGGILDRFDAFIFCIPFVLFISWLLN